MFDIQKATKEEISALISEALRLENIYVVLSGGSAVEHYSSSLYISDDIDLININNVRFTKIKKIMLNLGFIEYRKYFIVKNRKDIFVEFPSGPLAVSDEYLNYNDTNDVKTRYGNFRIISIEDCIKDRLEAFFYWNDRQSLYQAILLVIENFKVIDIDILNIWGVNKKDKEIKWNYFISIIGNIINYKNKFKDIEDISDWMEIELDRAVDSFLTSNQKEDYSLDNVMKFYTKKYPNSLDKVKKHI